ncbi:hypothetical protein ASPTUDRAFT_43725 [Aspergillus tubingensis CBS 134.48]|uniref:Uncharacterized protein n=1 Tax=Aspergillus tubingensis (strain CBS 134.48) TaxID=767770 RepID=A0A1L9MZK8_ASPTC|nr:hypothetical protein ASPTUDRAFT_43725 [Aspergillus tubingensis CBS 134.48]
MPCASTKTKAFDTLIYTLHSGSKADYSHFSEFVSRGLLSGCNSVLMRLSCPVVRFRKHLAEMVHAMTWEPRGIRNHECHWMPGIGSDRKAVMVGVSVLYEPADDEPVDARTNDWHDWCGMDGLRPTSIPVFGPGEVLVLF